MKNPMSEEEREDSFPVHVEMGEDGPVLDLGELPKDVTIPASGCLLVDYTRQEDGTLKIKTVCLPEESDENEPADLNEAFNQVESEDSEEDEDDE